VLASRRSARTWSATATRDQDQGLNGGLPFGARSLVFWQLSDQVRSLTQGFDAAAIVHDRITAPEDGKPRRPPRYVALDLGPGCPA
jgi:hypothetical protein